jgi:hypothetical protein
MSQPDPLMHLFSGLPSALLSALNSSPSAGKRAQLMVEVDVCRRAQVGTVLQLVVSRITGRELAGLPDSLQLSFGRARHVADLAVSRLQTVPALVLEGPHIQLLPEAAENRLAKLRQITDVLPKLERIANEVAVAPPGLLPELLREITSTLDFIDSALLTL